MLRIHKYKLVTINGSFDLLHAGHIKSLKLAKEQGDILIVGLNSDKSIKIYKSKDRPIIAQEQRAEMLDAIRYVDYIVIMDEPEIAVPLIKIVKPHIHVNSAEYSKDCVESKILKEIGAKLVLIPKYKKISTTNVIKKIHKLKH